MCYDETRFVAVITGLEHGKEDRRMHLRGTMAINELGHLTIGGCDTVTLAQQYGTPLYVLDEEAVRKMARSYVSAFQEHLPVSEIIYAGKALMTIAVCRIMAEEGLSLDVVSGGELYTALAADFPPERIYFHGNNKSRNELQLAVEHEVGCIVVDNFYELEMLQELAASAQQTVDILLRITPGVEAHTHSYIQTGQLDSKFGFGLASGQALAAVQRAAELSNLQLRGVHCHIGSQIFDLTCFEVAVGLMIRFMTDVREKLGMTLKELDLGGGLGIRYKTTDRPPHPEEYARIIGAAVKRHCQTNDFPIPKVMVEPGRSIVGEAGTTLYTIGSIKDIPQIRRYVAIDGGMGDNPRVALYQAEYEGIIANKANVMSQETVTIAGKCCESGDMLIRDIKLPPVEPGDILAVFSTGAYNYSMASNYNRLPRPAMITVYQGESEIIVKRESYADLIRNDRLPRRLAPKKQTVAGSRA